MSTYTNVYTTWARNVAPAALVSALAAIPRNVDVENVLQLIVLSDVTTNTGPVVRRTIARQDNGASGVPLPSPQPAAVLTNLETISFARGLRTQVIADPVVVT